MATAEYFPTGARVRVTKGAFVGTTGTVSRRYWLPVGTTPDTKLGAWMYRIVINGPEGPTELSFGPCHLERITE